MRMATILVWARQALYGLGMWYGATYGCGMGYGATYGNAGHVCFGELLMLDLMGAAGALVGRSLLVMGPLA